MSAPAREAAGAGLDAASPARGWVYAAMVTQSLISAGTFLVGKRALAEFLPLEFAWMRFLLAALAFAAILTARGKSLIPPRRSIPKLLLLGFIALPTNQCLFLTGLSMSTPGHAAIMYALTPAMVLIGARVFLGERLGWWQAGGIAIAFTGAMVVLFEGGLELAGGTLVGDLFLFSAVMAWSLFTVLARPVAREHGALCTTGWSILAGALLFSPAGFFVVRSPAVLETLSPEAWFGLLYLAFVTSVIAYYLYGFSLKNLEAAKVAVFANLQPVLTVLLAWWLLGDAITWLTILGGLLVITGVTALQRRETPRASPAPAAAGGGAVPRPREGPPR